MSELMIMQLDLLVLVGGAAVVWLGFMALTLDIAIQPRNYVLAA